MTTGGTREVAAGPANHFVASFYCRAPSPTTSTRAEGRLGGLSPGSKGAGPEDRANRRAQVRAADVEGRASRRGDNLFFESGIS